MRADELRELRDIRVVEELVPESTFRRMRGEALRGKSSCKIYPYQDCVVNKSKSGSTDSEHESDMEKVVNLLCGLGYSVETHFKFGERDLGVSYFNVEW